METLAELRANESATFQSYNNAVYEQANPDEVEARKERFERVEAEKQAYLDSLSSQLRAQVEAEQQRRMEQARAATPEIREKFAAAEASDPATIAPPQPIQGPEAEVPQVEKARERQLGQVEQPEEPELQLGLQAAEIEEAPEPQPDLQVQQEEAAPAEVAAAQYREEEVDPDQQEEAAPAEESTPPPSEGAETVAAEAASFIGTPAVEEDAAPNSSKSLLLTSSSKSPRRARRAPLRLPTRGNGRCRVGGLLRNALRAWRPRTMRALRGDGLLMPHDDRLRRVWHFTAGRSAGADGLRHCGLWSTPSRRSGVLERGR